MELAVYIKTLLYNRDILIIPGLGGLSTHYKPAEIDVSQNIISPPTKFLVFDQQLSSSDSSLVEYIAEQRGIGKTEAEAFVLAQVNIIEQKFDQGETVFLEGIGYFSKVDGVIRFDHEQKTNFLTESFGLANVDFKSVELKLTPQYIPDASPENKKKSLLWLYIIIGIFVIGGGATAYLYRAEVIQLIKNRHFIKPNISSTIVKPQPETIKKVETPIVEKADSTNTVNVEKAIDVNNEKKNALSIAKEAKETKETKEPLKSVESAGGRRYLIIAGSFKTKERSQILVNILKKQGLKGEIIEFQPDLYRVSLGSFQKRSEAVTELEKVKAKEGMDKAWLLAK